MSRVYAAEEGTGRRFLARIECDAPGCEQSVRPHAEIAQSGWTKRGNDHGLGSDKYERDYCPEHS